MLEEVFQQTEVENDKNLVIYQKSADTQKHYKVCQKLFCWDRKRFTILFLQAYIASIMKFLEKITCIDLRTNEIMYLTTERRNLELPHFA